MRAMIHRGWIATILLAAIAGCQAQSPTTVDDITEVQSALSATISIPVPIGLNPSDVGIGAIGQLYVNDRAQVREQADSTILAQIANVGFATGSTTNIGVTSQVGTINSVPRVTLRRGAFVSGSVYEGPAGGPIVQGPFTVTGFTASNAIPAMIADGNWKQTVTWPFNVNASVSLEPGQTPTLVQLAPAAYHDVSVKSGRTLQLRAGTYYFDSLFIDVSGGLQIDGSAGPVYVFVNGPVTFRGNMNGSTATPGLPIASLTIMTTGSASIGSSFQSIMFNGVVIASGSIGITGLVRGAFFGTNVTLFEDSQLFHVRDPFSFRGFGPSDEVSVTGGSIRKGGDVTDEFTQSETATAISKNGQQLLVAVGYNDKTTGITNPEVTYPNGRTNPGRIVHRGVSLLGWSVSTDGGYTFNYGGRVKPPTGWSAIWGDPAMAKVSLTDPNVYYAEMATTDAAFTNTTDNRPGFGYDPATDTILTDTPDVDGHCIARSTDFGVTFSILTCVPITQAGFSPDGTSLAVAMNTSGVREVYLSTNFPPGYTIVRVNDQTGATTALPSIQPPPLSTGGNPGVRLHPKLKVLNGVLYLVAMDNAGRVYGATLDAAHSATTWQGPVVLATDGSVGNWGGARAVSYDIGSNGQGGTKFRFMYLIDDGGGTGLATRECNVDLSNCQNLPWNTRGVAGNETQPSLKNGGGAAWAASWMGNPAGQAGVSAFAAQLRAVIIPPTQNDLVTIQLTSPVIPCAFTSSGYWGDYNEMDSFGDLRYFAPYTVNGPGCRYQGPALSDQHVGASIFRF